MMTNEKHIQRVKLWAAGMVEILTNAEPENVMREIQLLLERLGLNG